jgi:hypothetical protein
MANLSGLVTGLTKGLIGYQGGRLAGQQQARTDQLAELERQRQARQDLLAQQLTQAQLGNYQSLASERAQTLAANQHTQQMQDENQRAIHEAANRLRAVQGIDPRLAALPDQELIGAMKTQLTQAPRNIDPWSPEAVNARIRIAAAGAANRPPSASEEKFAGVATEMRAAVDEMKTIAQDHPEAVQEAAKALNLGLLPVVGHAAEALRSYGLSPQAQEFVGAYKRFQLGVTPLRAGSRPNQYMLYLEQQATAPAIGEDLGAWSKKIDAMDRLVSTAERQAGRALSQSPAPQTVGTPGRQYSPDNPFAPQ